MESGMYEEAIKKIAEAQVTVGGERIRGGAYLYTIKSVVLEKKQAGVCFIAEFLVNEAQAVESDVEPNLVGSCCSAVYNFSKHLSAPGNAKTFVLAALGHREADVSQEQLSEAILQVTSSGQPLIGVQIRNSTYRQMTRDGKINMTLSRFEHVPNQSAQDIAGRRREIEVGVATPTRVTPSAPSPVTPAVHQTTASLPGPAPTTVAATPPALVSLLDNIKLS